MDLDRDVIGYFRDSYGLTESSFTADEMHRLNELVVEKYDTDDWVYALP